MSYLCIKRVAVSCINSMLKVSTPLRNRIGGTIITKGDVFLRVLKEKIIFGTIKELADKNNVFPLCIKDGNIKYDNVIWTAWFQGAENMPPLIDRCISSFKKIKSKNVIIIDKFNYKDYISLPDEIINKFESGNISFVAFSEIVRMELLANYGGLWLDATVYIDKEISDLLNDKAYLSLKSYSNLNDGNVMGIFPVYFIFAKTNVSGIKFIRDILLAYWLHFDDQIDYFLIDYIFKFTYRTNAEFKYMVDNNPLLGIDRFLLKDMFDNEYNHTDSMKLQNNPVGVYKLSNKLKHKLDSSSGNETFYSMFMNDKKLY